MFKKLSSYLRWTNTDWSDIEAILWLKVNGYELDNISDIENITFQVSSSERT